MATTRDEISNYEQGRVAVPLGRLYEMVEALSINIMDLLELTEDADDKVENELPDLIKEYKKIESQELRYALIKSLLEEIRICKEKVERVERMKIARNLVKEGISINIILKTVGISLDEIQQV
ncbi:hypothetical protein Wxf_02408 [Wolbachia endosymbiont of Armadillidium vulgare]|nr:hypothetical protein Wxf_00911 [Wolbachia endosymbiont of Armadillidium vulgare]OJH32258.1 hypothetical protein Wxf_01686 [Wolbachia endosymbiont of Armadillidium vulgare]OJH32945.1 hypothetical protein Wxf_02408 [Wolbachia endosymbiont of Armadillidium vulgare]